MKKELRQELIDFAEWLNKRSEYYERYKEYPGLVVLEYSKSIDSNASAESQSVSSNESEKVVCDHPWKYITINHLRMVFCDKCGDRLK